MILPSRPARAAHRPAKPSEGLPAQAKDWIPAPPLSPDSEAQRSLDRLSHLDLFEAVIAVRFADGGDWLPARLRDFSSLGFGVFLPNPSDPPALEKGRELELRLRLGTRRQFLAECAIQNLRQRPGGFHLGLRRLDVQLPRPAEAERRQAVRLALAPALELRASVLHPLLYGRRCALQVFDLNSEMGLCFLSRDPSLLLFEGMELKIRFELASFRHMPMTARVTWVHVARENEIRFGVRTLDMDYRLHNALCDFMLHSRMWTPSTLHRAGFLARKVKSHLRFRAVKSMEDYAEVLTLRRDAYVQAGRKPPGTAVEEMAGPLDGNSRILMAHHHGVLVGTLTFSFPAGEDTVLDSEAGFPGGKYPVPIPPKKDLIEVSRLCTHPEYRGTDLLSGLFEQALKHFLLSDRRWLLTSAVEELLPLYRRVGFRRIGASYRHPLLDYQEHHLILAHRNAFLGGLGINPLVWSAIFGDLIRFFLARNLIVSRWTRLVLRFKLSLQPLAKALLEKRSRAAYRRHLETLKSLPSC